jgi:tight adherence protein B
MNRALFGAGRGLIRLGGGRRRLRNLTGAPNRWHRPALSAVLDLVAARPKRSALGCAAAAAAAVAATAGPVAAGVAATYAAVAVTVFAARRRDARKAVDAERVTAAVGRAAAELRAGADPAEALAEASSPDRARAGQISRAAEPITGSTPWVPTTTADRGRSAPRVDARTSREATAASVLAGRIEAARRVAEDTGAPLADLLDRLEADASTAIRARASAAAQASGAQATAWLLAALPAAGIALGTGVGADPLHVLLHTPLGALCATAAIVLQIAGLAWVHRLAASITAVA